MSAPSDSARPWALITGASEGLGKEFAVQMAQRKTHNLILAARSVDKLNSVAKSVSDLVECKVIKSDLSVAGAAEKLDQDTRDLDVALLINNAGVAFGGPFEDMEYKDVQSLVAINVVALTELFHLFLQRIRKQHTKLKEAQKTSSYALSGIVNIGSMSSFMPIPSMALYAASKAFVLSLTESAYAEQRNEGSDLRIVVSCPGVTKTEIWTKGGANDKGLLLPLDTPQHVCAATLSALDARNKPVIIPGYFNNISIASLRIAPRSLVRYISRRMMGQDLSLRDADEVKETFAKLGRSVPTRS
ncbi:Short-chain dehydrogenase/reductase SDR [Kalmanozyma brasiliensis GHG001]|uniref:Short-chain dehydrogenase/reductase n=1 Tax=Kalmanozyma brasiliensis (strain GHG001) TaxID=1365824 RepID=V5EZ21_KALBG|nr:Short-chain dehydrogenase/reductase SDR [Kalmanozyma brasiliensis GHG001]EST09103.1 Short-chain dehydrogenase/reductase SDR [Kalmanozyma brasiliensis GHG001]